jgi:hypothetical protein
MRRIRSGSIALGLAASATLGGGCATIFNGPNQKIEVFTEPPGASVTVGSQRVLSPGVLKLPRREEATVQIELAGYQTRTVKLIRKNNEVVWLDLAGVAGGIVAGVAAATAASVSTSESVTISPEAAALVSGIVGASGFAVDFMNGSAYKLDPARIVVTLLPAALPAR